PRSELPGFLFQSPPAYARCCSRRRGRTRTSNDGIAGENLKASECYESRSIAGRLSSLAYDLPKVHFRWWARAGKAVRDVFLHPHPGREAEWTAPARPRSGRKDPS